MTATNAHARIPRLAVRLLEWRFPADEAEAIVGDLSEEFSDRAGAGGAGSARRWFWRQTIISMAARRKAATSPPPPHVWPSGLVGDMRLGLRGLRRSPGFAIAAIATLSLGIGAATAVGTAASRVLLRALPFPAGHRLIAMGHARNNGLGNVGFETAVDWRARMTTVDEIAIIRQWQPALTDSAGAVRLDGMRVSANFFKTLGVQPALGRDFEAADDVPTAAPVVILSDGFWRRRFGGSPAVVGATIDFNGRAARVVGVMPASFEPLISEHFFAAAELWAPLGYAVGGPSSCRTCQHLKTIARMKPGVTLDQARAELIAVQAALEREYPKEYSAAVPVAVSLQKEIAGDMTRPMELLMGAVAFVLLVACANVAGLLIARGSDRSREFALRSALGASRGRLIRQLLAESAILAASAALIGLVAARLGLTSLAAHAAVNIPRISGASSDPWLFGIASLTSIMALLSCAVIPALLSSRVNLESTLRETRQTAARGTLRLRESLMVIEIAAALLVVAGGGLMYRTVAHLTRVDPGFTANGLMTANLSLVGKRWANNPDVLAFQTELLRRLEAVPGVSGAAIAGQIPLGGNYDMWGLRVEGRPLASEADAPNAERYSVTPNYFRLLNIPLKQGRLLTAADRDGAEKVIVISETAARQIFPGESPLGKQVRFGSDTAPNIMRVVGVVGDVRHYSLATEPTPQFYATQEQIPDSFLVVLVRGDHPEQLGPAIRREVAALASDVPVHGVVRFDTLVARSIGTRSFLMMLLSGLGAITLILAGVGLYGVVSQAVAVRRRELGIRVALGASRASVLLLIARRGFVVFAGGAAAGLVGAAFAGYAIQGQLFETTPLDPLTMAGAVGALALVTAAAHFMPVRRALAADPTETLRPD